MGYLHNIAWSRSAERAFLEGIPFTVLVRKERDGGLRISKPVRIGKGNPSAGRRRAAYAIRITPKASLKSPPKPRRAKGSRTENFIRDAVELLREDRCVWFHLGVDGVIVSYRGNWWSRDRPALNRTVSWAELATSEINPLTRAAARLRTIASQEDF